jgi:hypothetical protein
MFFEFTGALCVSIAVLACVREEKRLPRRKDSEKCKLGLSLNYVRGPLRLCLGRCMVFHRFDHTAHRLDATRQCPAHQGKVLSAYQFSAVSIDTLNA